DGIRDRNVTGVQTCALPIFQVYLVASRRSIEVPLESVTGCGATGAVAIRCFTVRTVQRDDLWSRFWVRIGESLYQRKVRRSWREPHVSESLLIQARALEGEIQGASVGLVACACDGA